MDGGIVKRCCRCGDVATYLHPRWFCDEHWARWWGGYDPELPYEDGDPPSEEMYIEALAMARRASIDERN